eukprot:sb/3474657/
MEEDNGDIEREFGVGLKFDSEDQDDHHDEIIWVLDQELGHKPSDLGETEIRGCFEESNKRRLEFYVSTFLWVKFKAFEDREDMIKKAVDQLKKKRKREAGQKRKGDISDTTINMKVSKKGFYDSRYFVANRGTSP